MNWMEIGPTLGLVAGGGGIAAVAGAVGALYQSRREHSRWLRDLRLQRFEEFASAANGVIIAIGQGSEVKQAIKRLQASESVLSLVGPERVYHLGKTVADLAVGFETDPEIIYPFKDWTAQFNAEARKVIKIPGDEPFSWGRL